MQPSLAVEQYMGHRHGTFHWYSERPFRKGKALQQINITAT